MTITTCLLYDRYRVRRFSNSSVVALTRFNFAMRKRWISFVFSLVVSNQKVSFGGFFFRQVVPATINCWEINEGFAIQK